ncbi:BspA family leucine-rich repeat surface protein [Lactobacillus panisapium]|uniref:BspA family leucine-rich repeat surface protein n=1 Tax=Lactobacillus panisapium TaxID=2012495 RepID=A0ABX8WAS2_9LACO|nr:BspA family leucine-rich repeat surface protein [Lactobacillus panisapium]QYN53293.1 BspA family leucine-rich repeat surface protein [Lactobacillus panisapium]
MKNTKKKNGLIVSTTVVGLVCGLVLTQQQAKAATVDSANEQNSTIVQAPKADKATEPNTLPAESDSQENADKDDNSPANVTEDKPAATIDKDTDSNVSASNEDANKQTAIAKAATTPEVIDQGTWGTSKWEYKHEGDDYVLYLHAGTLGESKWINSDFVYNGILKLNSTFKDQLTKIKIDQGVVANQESGGLFYGLSKLTTIEGLSNLNTANVTNMRDMFGECSSLTSLDLSHFDTSKVTNMYRMFEDCSNLSALDLSSFDTAKVTDLGFAMMFFGCDNLATLNISSFNTANATNMYCMFFGCKNLVSLDLSHFDTSNITDMGSMFDGCSGLTSLDLSHFDTSKVTDMDGMFDGCSSLPNLDLSHFDTSKVTNIYDMFYGCKSLTSLDLSHFDTSKVTDMFGTFSGCSSLISLDLSHFDTSKVTDMRYMFYVCSSLTSLDLSNFNTSNVKNMSRMFDGCNKLNHLVLGSGTKLTSDVKLPAVLAVNTVVSGSNRIITAPYWVATSGYEQGKRYTSDELMSLTGRDQVTTYDWVTQTVAANTTQTKAVTRLIVVHQPDGSTKTDAQTVMITRPVIIKPNGSISWGNWTTAQWTAHEVPAFAGYNPSVKEIPAQTVTSQTGDQAIDIYYDPIEQTITVQYVDASGKVVGTQEITGYTGDTLTPNYHAPAGYELAAAPQPSIKVDGSGKQVIKVSVNPKSVQNTELKTITRTINVHQPDGSIKTYNQVAVIRRTVSLDQITGEKTYGSWHNDSWDEFKVPAITGYTPSQATVTGQEVTANSENEQVEIYYSANK